MFYGVGVMLSKRKPAEAGDGAGEGPVELGADAEPALPRSYHHGNLRHALIEAALELVAERGPQGFTLREVARRAGVSHAAPYRHFADRAALLAATAERAYVALDEQLQRASEIAPASEALHRLIASYVEFALGHPTRFRLLFEHEVRQAGYEPLERAAAAVFARVVTVIQRAQQEGAVRAAPAEELGLVLLSMMHGLARLCVDTTLPPALPNGAPALVELAYATLARGLGP